MSELELRTMLKRGGASIAGERALTAPERADVTLLRQIQALAKQHGWSGQHSYRGDTDEEELDCLLAREVLLYALLTPAGRKLTPRQLAWVTALRATGAVEVYIWAAHDLPAITQRLTRKRGAHG